MAHGQNVPMPSPSQPKRSVPWAAIAGLALMLYVGGYPLVMKREPGMWSNARFGPDSIWVGRFYAPAAYVEAKITRRDVHLVRWSVITPTVVYHAKP